MDNEDVAIIKGIIAQELPPALERIWNERGPAMQAAIQRDVVTAVRSEVRQDHSENRARLKLIESTASQAEQKAASADTKATEILKRVDEHYAMAASTDSIVRTMSAEMAQKSGIEAGKRTERGAWIALGKWAAGILTGGGLMKIYQIFHH